jgi:hypothetical protein
MDMPVERATLADLARSINAIVRGWINYYGRFYRSQLIQALRRIDDYLVRWAMRKYKRLRGRPRRARSFLATVARREPALFAHWRAGARAQACGCALTATSGPSARPSGAGSASRRWTTGSPPPRTPRRWQTLLDIGHHTNQRLLTRFKWSSQHRLLKRA